MASKQICFEAILYLWRRSLCCNLSWAVPEKPNISRELLAKKPAGRGKAECWCRSSIPSEILHKAGPGAASIQVYSFTRLAEAVFREEEALRTQADRRRQAHSHVFGHRRQRDHLNAGAARSGRISDLMLTAVNGAPFPQAAGCRDDWRQGLGKKSFRNYGAYEALVEAPISTPETI